MDNVSLGELIRKKRKEKQMTQGELASLLYVSTNAISKWELGKTLLTLRIGRNWQNCLTSRIPCFLMSLQKFPPPPTH